MLDVVLVCMVKINDYNVDGCYWFRIIECKESDGRDLALSRSLSITAIAISGGNVMAEEMKKIDNDELEKVDGGMASFQALKQDLNEMIPAEVREKLKKPRGDVGVSKILAENGIDVEKIEKRIEDAGFELKKTGFQGVADELLDKVSGGSAQAGVQIKCKCGNCDRNKMSFQFLASLAGSLDAYYGGANSVYRCELCDTYIYVYDNRVEYA